VQGSHSHSTLGDPFWCRGSMGQYRGSLEPLLFCSRGPRGTPAFGQGAVLKPCPSAAARSGGGQSRGAIGGRRQGTLGLRSASL